MTHSALCSWNSLGGVRPIASVRDERGTLCIAKFPRRQDIGGWELVAHQLALKAGIQLSPAYDMNPWIDRAELTLAINEVETACDVAIAMDAYKDYGLTAQQADNALQQVQTAVQTPIWP